MERGAVVRVAAARWFAVRRAAAILLAMLWAATAPAAEDKTAFPTTTVMLLAPQPIGADLVNDSVAVNSRGKPGELSADTNPGQDVGTKLVSGTTRCADECRTSSELSLQRDCRCLLPDLWHDVEGLWSRQNGVLLLAAGGASFLAHEEWDDHTARYTAQHPNRWGKVQDLIGGIGNPVHHFAAIGGIYLCSLHNQDDETHDLSRTLLNAVTISGASTVILKEMSGTGTVAPNRKPDPFGGSWPSGHTSSSFAFAAVLDEYYGAKVGIPAYVLAGLVGWERIDDREHRLSDVVFGAALGYVIGKTVAADHRACFCGMHVEPFIDPQDGSTGLSLERRF